MMVIENNEQLVEFIADHLPISYETAWHFVDAAVNGYMFGSIDHAIALSVRDRRIKELEDAIANITGELARGYPYA